MHLASLSSAASAPDGPLARLTDANGNALAYAYDGFNRSSVVTYPGGTTESFAYDGDGNVLARTTRKGDTLSFAYDTLNRVCSKAVAASPTPCAASSSVNPTVWYGYDRLSRPVRVTDNGPSIVAPSGAPASYATATTYDANNRPLGISWNPAPAQATPGAASVTVARAYDANNRRNRETTTDNGWFSYPAAAPSTVNYTANALNQYTAVGAATPSYDANGNLTSDGGFGYCYDAENRLTAILSGGTCASPALVARYAFDAQGRRKSRTAGAATTVYVTDADNREVLEYDGTTGAVQAWYAYGQGSNEPLNRMDVSSGSRQTLIPDAQGSIVSRLDSASGMLTTAGYGAYGENPAQTTAGPGYTAQRHDPETQPSTAEASGLYYYRARMYSPTLGRFLQVDPTGSGGSGANLYAYVGNDPVNRTDPTGKCIEDFCVVETALVAACVEGGCEAAAVSIEALIFEGSAVTTTAVSETAATGGAEALGANAWRVALQPQNFTPSFVNSFARVGIANPITWDIGASSVPAATNLAMDEELGPRLIKSTIRRQRRGIGKRGSFWRAGHSASRCVGSP